MSQNEDDGVVKMNWCVISNGCFGVKTSSAVRSKLIIKQFQKELNKDTVAL